MQAKTNIHGETTVLTHESALNQARYNARHRHGEWFVWQHKSGEWYVCRKSHAGVDASGPNLIASLEDAALNVKPDSKVYLIGGGGRHSMAFTRFSASIIDLWERNAKREVKPY